MSTDFQNPRASARGAVKDAEAPPALVNQITRVACLIAGVPYPPESPA